jgi:hypothetical protein
MNYLKAVWKDGYEEHYAIMGISVFFWLHNGSWLRGSTTWDEMLSNIQAAGDKVKLVEWTPTAEEIEKLEKRQ